MEKPPLGLRPNYIWSREANTDRAREIAAAITRYAAAAKPIPVGWFQELNDVIAVANGAQTPVTLDGADEHTFPWKLVGQFDPANNRGR